MTTYKSVVLTVASLTYDNLQIYSTYCSLSDIQRMLKLYIFQQEEDAVQCVIFLCNAIFPSSEINRYILSQIKLFSISNVLMVFYIYRTFHKNDHVQGFDSRQLFIKRPASLMFAEYRSAPYLQGYGENEANSYILALSWDLDSAFSTSCILSNVNVSDIQT